MKKRVLLFISSMGLVSLFVLFGITTTFAEVEVTTDSYVTEAGKVTYIETSENVNQEELENIINEQLANISDSDIGKVITPYGITFTNFGLVRNGNSTFCELYFNFSGSTLNNAMRYSQIKVQNMNLVNKVTYQTFNAGTVKSIFIGGVNIPRGESRAHIEKSGIQLYSLNAGWNSVYNIGNTATIN